MKIRKFAIIIGCAALSSALSAQAHDPKEHMKDAEKPDCTAMDSMDHSKMDMNDPVMQAMMQQCMKGMHHNNSDKNEAQADPEDNEANSDEQHSEHQP